MNIVRLIAALIIDAVKAVFTARFRTDILQECIERVQPFATYANTTTTIVAKLRMIFAIAAFFHRAPSAIFRSLGTSMCRIASASRVSHETTAGRAFAAPHFLASDESISAARTDARIPKASFVDGLAYNRPSSELLTGRYYRLLWSWHFAGHYTPSVREAQ